MPWPVDALAVTLATITFIALAAFLFTRQRDRLLRLATRELHSGFPRRARAMARLAKRRSFAPTTSKRYRRLQLLEAECLFWEGHFERAQAFLDRNFADPQGPFATEAAALAIKCLFFREELAAAAVLFKQWEPRLRARWRTQFDACALTALFAFVHDEPDRALHKLRDVEGIAPPDEPFARAIELATASLAHRANDMAQTRVYLRAIIVAGGQLFVADWARMKWTELFPTEAPPADVSKTESAKPTHNPLASTLGDLRTGLDLLLLRTKRLRANPFSYERVVALCGVDALVVIGLRLSEYTRGAFFNQHALLACAAPLLLLPVAAALATSGRALHATSLQLVGAMSSALPVFAIAHFIASRLEGDRPGLANLIGLIALAWLLTIALVAFRRLYPSTRWWRAGAWLAMLSALFLWPAHLAADAQVFWEPPADAAAFAERARRRDEDNARRAQSMLEQADQLYAAEASLLPERATTTDLYFVGAAAWAPQDVFLREVSAARELFDRRFDTQGRSLMLSNDPSTFGTLPLAAPPTLRHVLKAVGARMNRDEDVLFLFVTSHGSKDGLGVRFPDAGSFMQEDEISPAALRTMLDDAGIRWRVLVISGCHSGVFVEALRNDETLLATAAASDRVSFGCSAGHEFTAFGRAMFGEALVRETSFPLAFTRARDAIAERERAQGQPASDPQIVEGKAVRAKLQELENRFKQSADR